MGKASSLKAAEVEVEETGVCWGCTSQKIDCVQVG